MTDRRQEGDVLLRRDGQTAEGPFTVTFAPSMGAGGAMEQKRFGSLESLRVFLKELRVDPSAQRLALADLERAETAMIPNVCLTTAELREHWPMQFAEKPSGVA